MNQAITVKNDVSLSLPELEVPVMKHSENEEEISGHSMLEEKVIGSRVPGIWMECVLTKDGTMTDDIDKGERKILYIDYNTISNFFLTFNQMPSMSFTIDRTREYNTKVGDKVYLCLVPMNEDCGYDKIKLQFHVSEITKTDTTASYTCTYYVDNLYSSYPLYYNDKSSYDIALELTKELQIGFKSNVDAIEDLAFYKSNQPIIDTLFSMRYGSDMTDLFDAYIDEDNYFNLVNVYNVKMNIESDFTFVYDIDNSDTDNSKGQSMQGGDIKFTNFQGTEMVPSFINHHAKVKSARGANTGDNFIFRYVDVDEYGMPTVSNAQLEYQESEGKTVLVTLSEQTKEDVENKYVNKELLSAMKMKIDNKLFADVLEIDSKYVYGLKKYQQVLVEIYNYDGIKKVQGEEIKELTDNEDINPDTTPSKDIALSGQYLILSFNIYYSKEKGELRAKYRMFKVK